VAGYAYNTAPTLSRLLLMSEASVDKLTDDEVITLNNDVKAKLPLELEQNRTRFNTMVMLQKLDPIIKGLNKRMYTIDLKKLKKNIIYEKATGTQFGKCIPFLADEPKYNAAYVTFTHMRKNNDKIQCYGSKTECYTTGTGKVDRCLAMVHEFTDDSTYTCQDKDFSVDYSACSMGKKLL